MMQSGRSWSLHFAPQSSIFQFLSSWWSRVALDVRNCFARAAVFFMSPNIAAKVSLAIFVSATTSSAAV